MLLPTLGFRDAKPRCPDSCNVHEAAGCVVQLYSLRIALDDLVLYPLSEGDLARYQLAPLAFTELLAHFAPNCRRSCGLSRTPALYFSSRSG
jgi:hypothetical protein